MSTGSTFRRGIVHALPFMIILVPFGMLFGVVATEAGLPLAEVMGFSVLVIAGASQFTALQLMQENAPVWLVLTASLAVNLRMAMYSAALVPHLGNAPLWQRALICYFNVDQTYALAQTEYDRRAMSTAEKVAYFFGVVIPICPTWYVATWFGAVLGTRIPETLALDFAVPIAFLAMIAPALRTLAHIAAATTSVMLALALAWLPSGIGVIAAGLVAMMVGARVEIWLEARGRWN